MANTVPQSGRAGDGRRLRAPTRGNLLTFLLAPMLCSAAYCLGLWIWHNNRSAADSRVLGPSAARATSSCGGGGGGGGADEALDFEAHHARERRGVRVRIARGGGEDDRRPASIARHRDGTRDSGRGAGMEPGRRCGGRGRLAIGERASTAIGTGAGSVRAYSLRPKIAVPRHGGTAGSRRRGDAVDRRISGRRAKGEAGGAVSNLCGGVWGGDGGGDKGEFDYELEDARRGAWSRPRVGGEADLRRRRCEQWTSQGDARATAGSGAAGGGGGGGGAATVTASSRAS
ncbi:hypothetical protein PAHAL_3G327200 [Panicum hallii]|uniref:Uncharacterized protein n=1 Tax=Panicum hallii TaxID=206008 RepID=A0A2T8KK67_9POAL|nr:hypothetical protein PAHAL_3G327200 [Panicum hallii]